MGRPQQSSNLARFDFSQTVLDFRGKQITIGQDDKDAATLGEIIATALVDIPEMVGTPQGLQQKAEGLELKNQKAELAERIWQGGVIEVTEDERQLMLRVVGNNLPPAVVRPVSQILQAPLYLVDGDGGDEGETG